MTQVNTRSFYSFAAAGSLALLVHAGAVGGPTALSPPAGEDFNTGNTANWTPGDPLEDDLGPTSFGVVNGAYRITSQPLPPIASFVGAGAGFSPSAVSPEEYSNGVVRGSIRFHNEHTNAQIALRATETASSGYVFFLNNFQDFIGIGDLASSSGNIDGINFDLEVGVEYMVEGRAVGDELSIKIWVHGEPEPAEPQVTVTDSNHTVGISSLIVYNQSSDSGGTGGALDASFDNFSFTPVGTTLLDDFVSGPDGWLIVDNLDSAGGSSSEVIDSEYHLGSAQRLPAGLYFTAAGAIDSVGNSAFANGVFQTKFRLNTGASSVALIVRDSGDGALGSHYLFNVEPTFQGGVIGIIHREAGQNVWQENVPFQAEVGRDYYLEATAIGDEFAIRVWAADESKPELPQVTATDSEWDPSHTGFGLMAYKGTSPTGQLSAAFSYAWFTPECPIADLNCDGVVDSEDLFILLAAWGECADCANCPADLNDDCGVDAEDLFILLANWG